MKNKEFWKGAVAGALVVTCIGTGAFAGTGLAAKGTALDVVIMDTLSACCDLKAFE